MMDDYIETIPLTSGMKNIPEIEIEDSIQNDKLYPRRERIIYKISNVIENISKNKSTETGQDSSR